MIGKVKNQIIEKISKIEGGKYCYDDERLLFIDLRDSLPTTDTLDPKISQIYEIFHFSAHPNSRDSRKTFNVSRKIINQFTKSIKECGSVNISLLDLTVTESLEHILDLLNIPYNLKALNKQEHNLMLNVYQLLDGVEIDLEKIKNDSIESAKISCDYKNDFVFIEFKVKPFDNTIGNLRISGSPTMRFRLL